MNLAFIICTEKGKIEKQSILLALSIRMFGGRFSDAPIYSFSPRKGFEPSSKTVSILEKLSVSHTNIPLNEHFINYPLANKPLTCSYAAETLSEDVLVFCDSDKVFLNEPSEFLAIEDHSILARPVDVKGIGVEINEFSDYWSQFAPKYKVNGKITTTIDQIDILPYFNSGLIVSKRTSGLFNDWKTIFIDTFNNGAVPANGKYFIEQSTFAIAAMQQEKPFRLLSDQYNIPIHNTSYLQRMNFNSTKLVSIHYHHLFFTDKTQNRLSFLLNIPSFKFRFLDNAITILNSTSGVSFHNIFSKYNVLP